MLPLLSRHHRTPYYCCAAVVQVHAMAYVAVGDSREGHSFPLQTHSSFSNRSRSEKNHRVNPSPLSYCTNGGISSPRCSWPQSRANCGRTNSSTRLRLVKRRARAIYQQALPSLRRCICAFRRRSRLRHHLKNSNNNNKNPRASHYKKKNRNQKRSTLIRYHDCLCSSR